MPWAKLSRLKFAFLKMSNGFENIEYFLRFSPKIFNTLVIKGCIKGYLTFPTKKYSILCWSMGTRVRRKAVTVALVERPQQTNDGLTQKSESRASRKKGQNMKCILGSCPVFSNQK